MMDGHAPAPLVAPLHSTISLTGFCNLDCVYCYAKPFSRRFIPYDYVEKILRDFKRLGVFVIKLAGGEPLLHPQIERILDLVDELQMEVAFLTNLSMPLRHLTPLLDRLVASPYVNIQVSLDSVDPAVNDMTRGQGAAVLSNIELLIERGVDIQVACVLSKHNIHNADAIIDHFYPRVRRFHYMNIMPSVKFDNPNDFLDLVPAPQDLMAFWDRVKVRKTAAGGRMTVTKPDHERSNCEQACRFSGCSAGKLFCDIDDELNVVACNIARDFVIGNLRDNDFETIWNSAQAARIRDIGTPLCHTHLHAAPMLDG